MLIADKINLNIFENLKDLIYPPVCGICGKLDRDFLCKKCEILLKNEERFSIETPEDKYFDEHICFFNYDGIIRKTILSYKFNEKSYIYKTFVNFWCKNKKFMEILQSYDIIMEVPISSKRMKQRGYNQSYLLARETSRHCENLQFNNNILYKKKNIIEQSKLNKEQRIENIKGVYDIANYEILKQKNVLLIDDIYTTGSTVNECSKVLRKSQLNKIGILTIAKDQIK